ncbi:MAG: TerD domain-containing protein [Planctomycetaceae bacterium]|jgi:tellurium resistance protein TerZ|nr:TerD domain-containing protein [Planctomycetaceae bacterium]
MALSLTKGQKISLEKESGGGKVTAQIMSKVYRHNSEWKMAAIGEPANGRTFHDILPNIVPYL